MVHFRVTVLNTTLSFVYICKSTLRRAQQKSETVTLEVRTRLEITSFFKIFQSVVCIDTWYEHISFDSQLSLIIILTML